MKKIMIIILIFLFSFLFSQTTIPAGNVFGTWSLSGSPYLIEGEIEIPDGQTLTIDPGCLIEFQGHYKFNVQGRLLAEGTEQDSIKFTVADTTGYYNNTHIGWHGIRFDNTPATNDSSKIVYCHLEFGKAIGADWSEQSGGAIYIDDFSKILISHCKFINNYANSNGGAIYDVGGIIIDNSIISSNQSNDAIFADSWNTGYFYNLIISNNSGNGIYVANNSVIINCQITNNQFNGIQVPSASPKIINNKVCNNGGYGLKISDSSPIIINNLICNNGESGIYIVEYFFGWSINPKITNCTIANNAGYGIEFFYDEWYEKDIRTNNELQNELSKIYSDNRSMTGTNNLLSGNLPGSVESNISLNLTYCAFSDNLSSFAGLGCISTEPYFVNPTMGTGVNYSAIEADWSLQSNSMCINHGTPDTTGLYLPEFDLAGNQRVFQGNEPRIDIGAYEFQGEPDQIPDIYVNPRNFDFYLCTIDSFSLEKNFIISNIGFVDLEITSIIAPEGFLIKRENDLEYNSSIDQFVIEPDSIETINIIFNPTSAIIYSGNITINSNDPDENISTVGVTGIGDIYPVVYGNISEDTIWDSDIIKVTGDIIVDNGITLTITPGTNVKIMDSFSLNIQGRILAEGTQQDTICFTSKDSNYWWKGIKFDNTLTTNDSSKFVFCKIERVWGHAVYVNNYSSIYFNNCVIKDNANQAPSGPNCCSGAGMKLKNTSLQILNCSFINNIGLSGGDGPIGMALFASNSDLELINCIFVGNGGGVIHLYSCDDIKFINCLIEHNNDFECFGSLITCNSSYLYIINTVISKNTISDFQTLEIYNNSYVESINSIFWNDFEFNDKEFGVYSSDCVLSISYNCIQNGINGIDMHGNINNLFWLEGNIEDDPLFIDPEDGNFHLQSESPCINAGTPSDWIVPSLNLPINELLGYNSIEDNYDIGFYEYRDFMLDQDDINFGEIPFNLTTEGIQIIISNISEEDILISSIEASEHFLLKKNVEDQYTDQIGTIDLLADSDISFWIACRPLDNGLIEGEISIYSNAIPSRTVINVSAIVIMVDVMKLYNNFPNPFNPKTTILFSIPQESKVELIVYNIKGQKVKTLIDHTCEMGINTAIWNGTNDSGKRVSTGVYFYNLNVNGKTIKTKKMLLLK